MPPPVSIRSLAAMAFKWVFLWLLLLQVAMPLVAYVGIRRKVNASELPAVPATFTLPSQLQLASDLPEKSVTAIRQVVYELDYPWQELDTISIVALDTNAAVCAYTDLRDDTIHLANQCLSASLTRVFAHELGHITDKYLLDREARESYCSLRGLDNCSIWEQDTFATDSGKTVSFAQWQDHPAEDFAEHFAAWVFDTKKQTRSDPSAADFFDRLLSFE